MNEYLLMVTISGYFVSAAAGFLVGTHTGKGDDAAEVAGFTIMFFGLCAGLVMLIALIAGFVEGVS